MFRYPWSPQFSAACVASLMLAGCATAGEAEPARARDGLTIEQILKWPFEDQRGIKGLDTALAPLFRLESLQSQQFVGKGPITLADGYTLRRVLVSRPGYSINVALEHRPCLAPAPAAQMIGAILDPVARSEHGTDVGQTYRVTRGNVFVRITTTPETYECVESISIYDRSKGLGNEHGEE